ncbi:MAG: cyclic nucleotide-binding domain-containing protein [Acidobacteria bacterium]|jgi:CRP-like cAMP-binding protein|nr:cyclic nucleotide-binding domain-containing protein [Acidobacteriota bacterium]
MGNCDTFILNVLKGMDIFSDVDDHSIRNLSALFEEKIYSQEEIIIEEGEMGNSMMIITSGQVRVSQTQGPDLEEALIVLKEGDVFGEMALIEDLPRSATIIAHTNVIIFEISRDHFIDYITRDSENGLKIVLKLAKILSSRLRETDVKLKAFVNMSQWI